MRKLLSSPVKMALSDAENSTYQNALMYISEISLNLMATKVKERPEDFLGWCTELLRLCRHDLNQELLDTAQHKPFKKLQEILESGASVSQLKMARIAPWPIFVDFIKQQSDLNALEERMSLLSYVNTLQDTPLAEMSENDRLAFAGKHTNNHSPAIYDFDCEWFASTKGAKLFHMLLATKPEKFDEALQCIPLTGDVTPSEYQNFVKAYKAIFSSYVIEKPNGEKAPLAPATRLLAMRRPDQFIALTTSKIDVLCQGLSIVKFNSFDFDGYWQDMIGTLRTFAWWHQVEPEDQYEKLLWSARSILVDLFLFADENTAFSSNYLRLKDKGASKSVYKSSYRPRTKLTPEELVDNALAQEDIPEYIQGKRESIIKEVKNGKSVEHVIGLMRAIFG
ncbi:hypothetical protein KO495_03825 [Colwellia sp. D2M02]|uniref:hypothetical protein n=1 Tax=Colwellia sp. D2M02 TaxID=2841562 RepID=UPI001C08FA8A|nr:hypothetical protein [Colwellia sp. D2M02]MBU2892452.1 hypothetical protein [Colwellia sp. D2M02]